MSPLAIATPLLLALTLGGPALARATDGPPSTPAGLVARAYGTTSGGIRWERSTDDRGVRGYEIVRDGRSLGIRDTLSVVERALAPGTSYRYAVTAIDTAGQRSGTSRVVLTTAHARPAAPTGLRAAVYSSTAAGIAWARPAVPGLRHEVRRDGTVLATSDAISHVDRALVAGRTYRYEVIAIGPSGRRSGASSILVSTPGANPTPPPDDPPGAPDCLGDGGADGTLVCVDPATRVITATRADGTEAWSVTLSEEELAGPIAALALAGGTPWLVALADTGPPCPDGDPGHCARTVTLAPIDPDSAERVHEPIPLGRAGFVPSLGTSDRVYNLDGTDVLAIGLGEDVYLAVDEHALVADADPALIDSWSFVGARVVRIAVDRAGPRRLAERLYPGRHVRALARTRAGELRVELDDGTERLDPIALVPVPPPPGRPLFAGRPYEAIAPELDTPLRDDALARRAAQVLALADRVRSTALVTTVLESDFPDPAPAPTDDQDSSERIAHDCAGGGTLDVERSLRRTYPEEALDELYRYADCGVTVPADDADLPGGTYRLDGVFVRKVEERFGSAYTESTRHEWRALALDTPEGLNGRTDGETTTYDVVGHGGTSSTRTTTIARIEERRGDELVLEIRDAEIEQGSADILATMSSRFGGHWSIGGTFTGGQSIAVRIDPAIAWSFDGTAGPDGIGSFTGRLDATAEDGSTLQVGVTGEHADVGAVADFTVGDATASLSERKSYEALRIPISVYAGDAD